MFFIQASKRRRQESFCAFHTQAAGVLIATRLQSCGLRKPTKDLSAHALHAMNKAARNLSVADIQMLVGHGLGMHSPLAWRESRK